MGGHYARIKLWSRWCKLFSHYIRAAFAVYMKCEDCDWDDIRVLRGVKQGKLIFVGNEDPMEFDWIKCLYCRRKELFGSTKKLDRIRYYAIYKFMRKRRRCHDCREQVNATNTLCFSFCDKRHASMETFNMLSYRNWRSFEKTMQKNLRSTKYDMVCCNCAHVRRLIAAENGTICPYQADRVNLY
jgi:hypothetical protein